MIPILHHSITPLESRCVVCQFHDVIEIAFVVSASDVQNINETGMGPRDWFESGHALELALECAFAVERRAINNFHCAPRIR